MMLQKMLLNQRMLMRRKESKTVAQNIVIQGITRFRGRRHDCKAKRGSRRIGMIMMVMITMIWMQ
jgi:hypothetical protein